VHQTEYQIEEHMYRVYMESGEDSGDYQELVRMREDVASKHWMMVGGEGTCTGSQTVSVPLCQKKRKEKTFYGE